ncbi:MAG: exodeoxyribonuclease VII small subunit [Clostridia bacterium]|nr:exodeoxyribonuclease VII small subunit [Clostridia bacterium]
MSNEMKFEEAIRRLGEIVRALENGEVALDDSIALFEEGMKLSKKCTEILETAEQKVRFLQQGEIKDKNE